MRRFFPYLFIITAFTIFFVITMILLKDLVIKDSNDWKIPLKIIMIACLQREAFVYALSFVILLLNILEILTTKLDKIKERVTKSLMTIVLAYLSIGLIVELFNAKTWGGLYHYMSNWGSFVVSLILTLVITSGLLFGLELMKVNLFRYGKPLVKYVPSWLSFENSQ